MMLTDLVSTQTSKKSLKPFPKKAVDFMGKPYTNFEKAGSDEAFNRVLAGSVFDLPAEKHLYFKAGEGIGSCQRNNLWRVASTKESV